MNFQFPKLPFEKQFSYVFLIAAAFIFTGCEPPKTNVTTNANTNTNSVSTNTASSANSQPATVNKERQSRMPVTMPVLDAMFSDESFAQELKSKLQLSDEEIDKVKRASREAVAGLNEGEDDSASGSTRASMQRADKQIRELLGDEKATRLFVFVRERWSGGEDTENASNNSGGGANTSKGSSVPTDTRVVVNAPAYRMDLFQDGKLVKTYKIGIGYPQFPLPSGMRRADTIIFNPTWTPPDEAWVKDSDKIKAGETVKAGDKLNPLGPIKIPIGLPSLIHGGKSPAKLGTFASHGCVGLTNQQVQDFAVDIANISGTNLTKEAVLNYAKQKTETENFKLGKSVPIELRYETIIVEDGKLKIFRDVYERGTNTEENLRRALESFGVSFDSLKEPERQKILKGLKDMAMDAMGNPFDSSANSNANTNVNTNANMNKTDSGKTNANKANSNNASSADEKVTRSIKGKKEVVFELVELKGKGYPAPMNMAQAK